MQIHTHKHVIGTYRPSDTLVNNRQTGRLSLTAIPQSSSRFRFLRKQKQNKKAWIILK